MPGHVVLLFEPDGSSKANEMMLEVELAKAGYEVLGTHNLDVAVALLYISRRIEVVVIDAASIRAGEDFAHCLGGLRSETPLVVVARDEVRQVHAGIPSHLDQAELLSVLEDLLNKKDLPVARA